MIINGSFRGQRITGTQRYATEIADRLVARGHVELRPAERVAASPLLGWAWSLGALPVRARRDTLLSLTPRIPVVHRDHVATVHDMFPITNPEWYTRRFVAAHAPMLRVALAGARAVVAVSDPVAEEIRASGLTKAPVVVAPNAPSTLFTEAVPGAAAPASGGHFLAVGSIDPRKNLSRLIDAYERLPLEAREQHPLLLVGGGHGSFADAGLRPCAGVRQLGYVSDEELAELYRTAHAVVFPTLAEGFGLPVVEAAASGARLILSDIPVFRWIVGDGARYVDPLSVEAIAAALSEAVTSPERLPFPDPALRHRFDWDESAAIVEAVCRD